MGLYCINPLVNDSYLNITFTEYLIFFFSHGIPVYCSLTDCSFVLLMSKIVSSLYKSMKEMSTTRTKAKAFGLSSCTGYHRQFF